MFLHQVVTGMVSVWGKLPDGGGSMCYSRSDQGGDLSYRRDYVTVDARAVSNWLVYCS